MSQIFNGRNLLWRNLLRQCPKRNNRIHLFFIIHSKDINTPDLPEEEKSKLIRVRHGTGIQFYTPLDQEDFISKYEGEWKLNQRNGQGKN